MYFFSTYGIFYAKTHLLMIFLARNQKNHCSVDELIMLQLYSKFISNFSTNNK